MSWQEALVTITFFGVIVFIVRLMFIHARNTGQKRTKAPISPHHPLGSWQYSSQYQVEKSTNKSKSEAEKE